MVTPVSVLSMVTSVLDELGIRYVLVGSFASSIYGLYRATADIDILADVRTDQAHPLYEALKDTFYVDELAMRRAITQKGSFNAIHFDSVFKVDIFTAQQDEFAATQLERRQLRSVSPDSEQSVYVASPEDTILAKLRWYLLGNESSMNHWNDVLGILAVMRDTLDLAYLHAWAKRLNVSDLLVRALEEANPSS
jgi:nucleotidyltransferase AbiEii toxin of type IV toxin-antitoxin system